MSLVRKLSDQANEKVMLQVMTWYEIKAYLTIYESFVDVLPGLDTVYRAIHYLLSVGQKQSFCSHILPAIFDPLRY